MTEWFVVYAVRYDSDELERLGEFAGDDHPADELARIKALELNTPTAIQLEVRDSTGTVLETQDWVGYFPEDLRDEA